MNLHTNIQHIYNFANILEVPVRPFALNLPKLPGTGSLLGLLLIGFELCTLLDVANIGMGFLIKWARFLGRGIRIGWGEIGGELDGGLGLWVCDFVIRKECWMSTFNVSQLYQNVKIISPLKVTNAMLMT